MGPKDWWIAECIPCGLVDAFHCQDAAIQVAEAHVYEYHRFTPAPERADKKMGHVQIRTLDSLADLRPFNRQNGQQREIASAVAEQSSQHSDRPGSPFPPDFTRGAD